MPESEILAELTEILRDIFDDPDLVVTRDTTADDIEDWDSANHINIVVAAESHFKTRFQASEIEELKNVGDFVDLIAKKQSR